ncbi:unnamed protein product, partial [Staurois parvus]
MEVWSWENPSLFDLLKDPHNGSKSWVRFPMKLLLRSVFPLGRFTFYVLVTYYTW